MRTRSRVLMPALLVATIAAALVPTAGPASGSAAGPAATGASTDRGRIAVRIDVDGCDGCTVTPYSEPTPDAGWVGASQTVTDGSATLDVPERRTRGLALLVDDPGSAGNTSSIAILRYARKAPGEEVSDLGASRARLGHHCWAGGARDVRWDLVVRHFPARQADGSRGYRIRPFLRVGRRTLGPPLRLERGAVASRTLIACRG